MAETASYFLRRPDVELYRAIHAIPFARLKDILCTHYGADIFDTEWRRVQGARKGLTSGNNNRYLYMSITYRLGKKDGAVRDIMRVYKDVGRMDLVSKSGVETLDSQQTQPLIEPAAEPSAFDNMAIEAAKSIVGVKDTEDRSEYLDASECNTTRSCCFDIGDLECYDSEDYSDEDYEYEESDWCSDQDDQCSASASVQGDDVTRGDAVTQGDNGMCHSISEEDTLEKPTDQDDRCSEPLLVQGDYVTRGDDVTQGDNRALHSILEDNTVEKPKAIIDDV